MRNLPKIFLRSFENLGPGLWKNAGTSALLLERIMMEIDETTSGYSAVNCVKQ